MRLNSSASSRREEEEAAAAGAAAEEEEGADAEAALDAPAAGRDEFDMSVMDGSE